MKYILVLVAALMVGCGEYIETKPLTVNGGGAAAGSGTTVINDIDITVIAGTGSTTTPPAPPPATCKKSIVTTSFVCSVHDFRGMSSLKASISSAPMLGSITVDKFDVTLRDWSLGFPKFTAALSHLKEDYAVVCKGKLYVATTAQHTLLSEADDGMVIYMNGALVLDNDGVHSVVSKSKTMLMQKGMHDVTIMWFQGPRNHIAAEVKFGLCGKPLSYMTASKEVCK